MRTSVQNTQYKARSKIGIARSDKNKQFDKIVEVPIMQLTAFRLIRFKWN